jgi:AraC family transcriptional regulator of adaptative response/methylated-DNA-[protein]-cysteine methyltransferase
MARQTGKRQAPQAPVYAAVRARWTAVTERDPDADGRFWFAVATTGVYCYPSCPARRPRRANVTFYETRTAAEKAGFRPCKRCRPDLPPKRERVAAAVARACRLIEEAEAEPHAGALAADVGLSPHELARYFKELTGVSPKRYAMAHRARRLRDRLADGAESVTAAVYAAGYGSPSRFYEKSGALLGMAPASYARGGRGQTIRWDVAESSLGPVLVAATARGICAILFGSSRRELATELARRFPAARLEQAEERSPFSDWIARVLARIDSPRSRAELPLDVLGTAFQQRVWQALREIPPGETATYGEIARRLGNPRATRAVGAACGANPIAVLIPCHRVLPADGSLGGYRWGKQRKRALLEREAASSAPRRRRCRDGADA